MWNKAWSKLVWKLRYSVKQCRLSHNIFNNWYKTLCSSLSTEHNAKLFKQLKSVFQKTINWNKYQSKKSLERPNKYLDYLIDPTFQGINSLFCFIISKWRTKDKLQRIFSSDCKNKIFCYDWWTKLFQSGSKR